jgi:hypothetical protein
MEVDNAAVSNEPMPTMGTEVGEEANTESIGEALGEAPTAAEPAEEEKEEEAAEAEAEAEAEEEEEVEAEAEVEEEEAPTTDAKETAEEPTAGRRRRERKSIESFVPGESNAKEKEAYPEGKGTKLKDIPNVVANFKSITWSDPHLRMLHTLAMRTGHGKKKELKSNLLEFSGIVYPDGKDDEEEREKTKEKMYKLKMPDLKSIMDLVDVDRSAASFGLDGSKTPDKEDHCNRLLEWLEKPEASGKKKAKVAGTAPKKAKETTAPKKRGRPSKGGSPMKSTSPSKKAKRTPEKKATATSAAKSPTKAQKKNSDGIDLNIPGVDIVKLREKVKSLVENANREEVTVKGIRTTLEDWLDTDLSKHKDAIRSIVMEAM